MKISIDLNYFLDILRKATHFLSKLNFTSILACSFLLAVGLFVISYLRTTSISPIAMYCLENKNRRACNKVPLRRKRLAHKEITNIIFTRCFCTDARLFNVSVRSSDFRENKFKRAHLEDVSFLRVDFFKATFYGAILESVIFEDSELGGVVFNFATLRNVYFKNVDLRSAVFVGTRFENSYYNKDVKLPFSKEKAEQMGLFLKE